MADEETKEVIPPNKVKIVDITNGRYIEINIQSVGEPVNVLGRQAYSRYKKVLKDGKSPRKISPEYA